MGTFFSVWTEHRQSANGHLAPLVFVRAERSPCLQGHVLSACNFGDDVNPAVPVGCTVGVGSDTQVCCDSVEGFGKLAAEQPLDSRNSIAVFVRVTLAAEHAAGLLEVLEHPESAVPPQRGQG